MVSPKRWRSRILSSHRATPCSHPFLDGIFHEIHHPAFLGIFHFPMIFVRLFPLIFHDINHLSEGCPMVFLWFPVVFLWFGVPPSSTVVFGDDFPLLAIQDPLMAFLLNRRTAGGKPRGTVRLNLSAPVFRWCSEGEKTTTDMGPWWWLVGIEWNWWLLVMETANWWWLVVIDGQLVGNWLVIDGRWQLMMTDWC